jgi:hypothetical protein
MKDFLSVDSLIGHALSKLSVSTPYEQTIFQSRKDGVIFLAVIFSLGIPISTYLSPFPESFTFINTARKMFYGKIM